jgi:hypothetical protein
MVSEYHLKVTKTFTKADLAEKAGNITAMVQIGSVGGALIAFIFCDKVGKYRIPDAHFQSILIKLSVVSGLLVNSV